MIVGKRIHSTGLMPWKCHHQIIWGDKIAYKYAIITPSHGRSNENKEQHANSRYRNAVIKADSFRLMLYAERESICGNMCKQRLVVLTIVL